MGQKSSKTSKQSTNEPKQPLVLTKGERNKLECNRVIIRVWTSQVYEGGKGVGHVSVEITRFNEPGFHNETEYNYISFWPHAPPDEYPAVNYFEDADGQRWSYIKSYIDDRLMENRKPEFLFCFYNLDTNKVKDAFRQFRTNPQNSWDMFGEYTMKNKSQEENSEMETRNRVESCVSLACLCLDAGEINKFMKSSTTSKIWDSITETSAVSSENSKEFKSLRFIQPSCRSSVYASEQLLFVCGFCLSPDVLVKQLKQAKQAEWNANADIKSLGRMQYQVTFNKESKDIESRHVAFGSILPGDERLSDCNDKDNGNTTEYSYEWLPND